MSRIGLIQTRGIGDIIIAMPIAQWFVDQGHEVLWPIDSRFMSSFVLAAPCVRFLPVDHKVVGEHNLDFFLNYPKKLLEDAKCDQIHMLYSRLGNLVVTQPKWANSLKFDEYKYAVAGVPFEQKWNLKIRRNIEREAELFLRLDLKPTETYIVRHLTGSNTAIDKAKMPPTHVRVIDLEPITDSIFDWISVLDYANELFMLDSCYANLVEQLNLTNKKHFIFRSDAKHTPVLKNNWNFYNLEKI